MTLPHCSDRDVAGKIVIFALGGTIAMTAGAEPGVTPKLSASSLVAAVPELEGEAITAISFRQKPSSHVTFADIEELADAIGTACADGARGIVVTLGTDALEEVSFALDLLLDVSVPVVMTGAMRNPTLSGADGPANLLAAVRLAGTENASRLGVLVAFNDEVHAARFVVKSHTTSPSTFGSPNTGRIGWFSEARAVLPISLSRLPTIKQRAIKKDVVVPVLTMAIGVQAQEIEATLRLKPDAVIVNAFGGGHVVPEAVDLLAKAAERYPVLLSSRTHAGKVLSCTYGYTGGEIDLLASGLIETGWLGPFKSRILAALCSRNGYTRRDLQALLSSFL